MVELPIARGLFLCESFIVEEGTRNVTLVNLFTDRPVNTLPSPAQKFAIFAEFINGKGTIPLRVTISDANQDPSPVLFEQHATMTCPDPLLGVRFLCRVENMVFEDPGAYIVAIESSGEELVSMRFTVSRWEDRS